MKLFTVKLTNAVSVKLLDATTMLQHYLIIITTVV